MLTLQRYTITKLMNKIKSYTFIDLFAGAGGLSEGFIRAGYTPIAHIEMNRDACNTLKTRSAFHYLNKNGMLSVYENYLRHKEEGTDGQNLWNHASGKFREIPSDFELLEIPHFAPVLIEKTKQNKTTISNNLKNSMMSFRDLLKSGTNPTLQSN